MSKFNRKCRLIENAEDNLSFQDIVSIMDVQDAKQFSILKNKIDNFFNEGKINWRFVGEEGIFRKTKIQNVFNPDSCLKDMMSLVHDFDRII